MEKKKNQTKNTADSAWEMFEKTGNVSYYLLYKRLNGED
ncbi:MAG: YqzL family protein [Clostridiales bacterium]|jgi:hypothetical protein|nr:YqzL family protein [Clostridiales bacterium]